MDVKQDNRRTQLIDSLTKLARGKLSKSRGALFQNFITNAIHFYPDQDYLNRPPEDIFWNIWGLYSFGELSFDSSIERSLSAHHAKVKVFNPSVESDSWSSQYTTIYINQKDMPFLVDSLRMTLNRRELNIYTLQSNLAWVVRDTNGVIKDVHPSFLEGATYEAFITIEVDMLTERDLEVLQRELQLVLDDVDAVVDDFELMRLRTDRLIKDLKENAPKVEQLEESIEFLEWIR